MLTDLSQPSLNSIAVKSENNLIVISRKIWCEVGADELWGYMHCDRFRPFNTIYQPSLDIDSFVARRRYEIFT